jgi:hypothetical protein
MGQTAATQQGLPQAEDCSVTTRQQLEAEWQKASSYATKPCPFCDGKNPELFCEHCFSSRVVLATHKVPLDRKRILSWGIFWFVLATFFLWVLVNQ